MNESVKCENCGAAMKIWKQKLTPGLVGLLAKFATKVHETGVNDVHLSSQMSVKANDLCNFPKLRYFGFVAKVKDASGNHVGGHWLLTRRGAQFLRGELEVPSYINTWRNHIHDRSETLVTIHDIKGTYGLVEYFQTAFDFEIHESIQV